MRILSVAFCILLMVSCQKEKVSSFNEDGSLKWLSMAEAAAMTDSDKPFFIDVYTDWCGWCKRMDANTFTDEEVKQTLAENFYLVKFNAEQKEAISFKGQEFVFTQTGRRGRNGLAVELLDGRLSYPSFVYLDKSLNTIKISKGYKDPSGMMNELNSILPTIQ